MKPITIKRDEETSFVIQERRNAKTGKKYIDFRKWFTGESGYSHPTSKGFVLTVAEFKQLKKAI